MQQSDLGRQSGQGRLLWEGDTEAKQIEWLSLLYKTEGKSIPVEQNRKLMTPKHLKWVCTRSREGSVLECDEQECARR